MKSINLSSPSVAYRHLQKLENTGYLAKNEYGKYTVKKKASLKGSLDRSKTSTKMWIYTIVCLVILIIELLIFFIHFNFENFEKFSSAY